jgi:hypothetical protein
MMQVTTGIAVVALFFTGSGPVSSATAQTIRSTYTSTAPKVCRVSSKGNGVDDSTIRVARARPVLWCW